MQRIGVYVLRIMADGDKTDDENQAVIDNIGNAFDRAEDAINDYLPEGYYCKVMDA